MADVRTAYKTSDPAIVAAWKATAEPIKETGNRAVSEAEAIGKNKGLMIQRSLDEQRFVGLAPIDPQDPPEGWRLVRGQFEPRRGRAGDDARAWLESVQMPSMRAVMNDHGLPKLVFGNGRMATPGMFLHDDTIWASYSVAPADDEVGPAWEKCRLSEYYAAQEATDAAADAA